MRLPGESDSERHDRIYEMMDRKRKLPDIEDTEFLLDLAYAALERGEVPPHQARTAMIILEDSLRKMKREQEKKQPPVALRLINSKKEEKDET